MDNDCKICAICRWNKLNYINTACFNPKQKDVSLKDKTLYDSTCILFELRDESFYCDDKK